MSARTSRLAETFTLYVPWTERELELVRTVKWYTSHIYSTLGADSRTQAIARAREVGLIAGMLAFV